MTPPTIHVTIVDSAGVRQTFRATHLDLDCGCGCIGIRAGQPGFCRGFDRGVMTLDDGISVKTVNLIGGMAALTGDTVHVVCERASLGRLDCGEHPIAPARCLHEVTSQQSQASSSNEINQCPRQALSPDANDFPAQPTEATTNKKHQIESYII